MSIELINVSHVSDGKTLIEDINLKIESGSLNVLLGRKKGNAGKTTLLRVISGLEVPSNGNIIVDGADVTRTRVQMRNVALVHQKFINYPHLTIRENISSPLSALGMKKNEIREKVEAIATQLHIENCLERYPDEVSGGQQQRTALARALVKEAKIVLLDEPLVNLDYKLREELRFELRELLKSRNAIAIYATTDPNEALALGGTSILMHEGKVIQQGLAADVYRKPVDIIAAKLTNDPEINILNGYINKNEIILGEELHFPLNSSLQTLSPGEYVFGIRPRHLSLVPFNDDDFELSTTIELAEISGSDTFLHVSSKYFKLLIHLAGVHKYRIDTAIKVYFPVHKLFVFGQNGETLMVPSTPVT